LEALAIPFGQSAILAPNWFLLRPLGRKLREYGIPVVGPGARPYKRSHLFARLAEHVCAYVDSPRPQFIRPIEAELFQLVANLTGRADFRIFTFNGRRVLFRLLQAAVDLRLEHESAVPWLRTTARHFGDILFEEGLIPTAGIGLLPESADALIQDMVNAQVDVANLALADLGMFANPESNLKLLTIHQAKGREFRAVALIGLHDGVIPFHNKYKHLSTDDEAEARRLMYVALTRAERLLHLYTTADNWRPICRFLPLLCK
jgi:DNA helicase II / ATP-dependent DNA helicase PcrA